jgi:hypothetical protein
VIISVTCIVCHPSSRPASQAGIARNAHQRSLEALHVRERRENIFSPARRYADTATHFLPCILMQEKPAAN